MPRTRSAVRLAIPLLAFVLVACGQATPSTTVTRVTESTVGAASSIPMPTADPILTISGNVAARNSDEGLVLDLDTIDTMGLSQYKTHDPWLEQDLEFTGVLITDLLRATGASADATTLHITALDDYEVDISIADTKRWPVMLATMTGGSRMSIEDKGPSRIVFPSDASIDVLAYKDLWIWQLKSIEVR